MLEIRYTVTGRQDVWLPAFPDDTAVQKVYLCAFVPPTQDVVGTAGSWAEDFQWRLGKPGPLDTVQPGIARKESGVGLRRQRRRLGRCQDLPFRRHAADLLHAAAGRPDQRPALDGRSPDAQRLDLRRGAAGRRRCWCERAWRVACSPWPRWSSPWCCWASSGRRSSLHVLGWPLSGAVAIVLLFWAVVGLFRLYRPLQALCCGRRRHDVVRVGRKPQGDHGRRASLAAGGETARPAVRRKTEVRAMSKLSNLERGDWIAAFDRSADFQHRSTVIRRSQHGRGSICWRMPAPRCCRFAHRLVCCDRRGARPDRPRGRTADQNPRDLRSRLRPEGPAGERAASRALDAAGIRRTGQEGQEGPGDARSAPDRDRLLRLRHHGRRGPGEAPRHDRHRRPGRRPARRSAGLRRRGPAGGEARRPARAHRLRGRRTAESAGLRPRPAPAGAGHGRPAGNELRPAVPEFPLDQRRGRPLAADACRATSRSRAGPTWFPRSAVGRGGQGHPLRAAAPLAATAPSSCR